jgi:lysosomal acid lipase/cholesteryl ester hydrolase
MNDKFLLNNGIIEIPRERSTIMFLVLTFFLVYTLWRFICLCCKYLQRRLKNQFFTESQIKNHFSKAFHVEQHRVRTDDGIELIMQRIVKKSCSPSGPKEQDEETSPPPSPLLTRKHVVFMQHGLLETSGIFVLGTYSIAFQLAELGFDVWLGNNRTNHYGQSAFCKSEHFQFTLDELIKYDFPAMIDYVIQHTQCQKLSFVGQSQGAGQCFAAMYMKPSLRDRFHTCVLLSPAIFLQKMPTQWLIWLLMKIPGHWFGNEEFIPLISLFQRYMPKILVAHFGGLMMKAMGFIEKPAFTGSSSDDVYKVFANIPSGCTSVNNLLHWFNMMRDGGCIRPYNPNPKEVYRIEDMLKEWRDLGPSTRIHVFLGTKDCVVDVHRTKKCFEQFADFCSVYIYEGYGHTDFIWGHEEVVAPVNKKIKELFTARLTC